MKNRTRLFDFKSSIKSSIKSIFNFVFNFATNFATNFVGPFVTKNIFSMVVTFMTALLSSCSTSQLKLGPAPKQSDHRPIAKCPLKMPHQLPQDAPEALDLFSDFFEAKCFREAIQLGAGIRSSFRQKTYSVSAEVFSVFMPETALSEYVLESYERAYLSFLMASAYLALGEAEDASVELRKSYSEGKAELYTYGEDPVNIFLLAAFWDNIGIIQHDSGLGRPFWQRLIGMIDTTSPVARFAIERLTAIDNGKHLDQPWRLSALGRLPAFDWSMNFAHASASGFYTLRPKGTWPRDCHSETGAVLSTASWMTKIGARYANSYHPLLHLKSWVRLPIGLAYGATTAAAGVGVALGGCYITNGSRNGCEQAFQAGGYLISRSTDVVGYTLAPDLRHWLRVPAAIMVTSSASNQDEKCWSSLPEQAQAIAFPLARAPAPTTNL